MIVVVALTFGLVVWIVAWALGVKAFDAFLFTGLVTVAAGGARIAMPFVDRLLKGTPAPGER